MTKKQEQKYLHQKLMYMLPLDVEIGKQFSYRFFDEKYYSPRTLKAFIFAFSWLEKNRNILPDGKIIFYGTYFCVKDVEGKTVADVNFCGCKFDNIFVLDEKACANIISTCKPIGLNCYR